MKKLLMMMLLLSSSLAHAEPEARDVLSELGVNTTLKVLKEINFPASENQRAIHDGIVERYNWTTVGPVPHCSLNLNTIVDYDRAILAGTELVVTKITKNLDLNNSDVKFEFSNPNITMNCVSRAPIFFDERENPLGDPEMTIGQFEDHARGIFEVILPQPVAI